MQMSAYMRAKTVRQALAANVKVNAAWDKFIAAYQEKYGTTYGLTLAYYLEIMVNIGVKRGEKVVRLSSKTGFGLRNEIDKVVREEARAYLRGAGLRHLLTDYCGREYWYEVA